MGQVRIDDFGIGDGAPLFVIAGPCVIEDEQQCVDVAVAVKEIANRVGISFIFKASYDKANRTSLTSFRGPGIDAGLRILARIREEVGVPVLSDVHSVEEAGRAGKVLDVVQVPALLSRQTNLLIAAGKTGKVVDLKKGQFMAPWEVTSAVEKVRSTGNNGIMLTERGASFGYNNLVSDMRAIPIMKETGCPVAFDATHSAQLPAAAGGRSGGQREMVPALAFAAVAAVADGLFLEVHPDPDEALCDGPNSWPLSELEPVLERAKAISEIVRGSEWNE